MGFNTLPFIFIFLPVFLAVYYLMPERLRNGVLTLGSLVFYLLGTWKRPWCLALLLGLMALTWLSGRKLAGSKPLLVGNLLVLGLCLFGFKYAGLLGSGIALPLGLSFYSFQMAAYVIDVYRGRMEPEECPVSYAAEVLMFPKLLSGPLMDPAELKAQMYRRTCTLRELDAGLRDFIIGLSMKVLLANQIGGLWRQVKTIGFESVSTPMRGWALWPTPCSCIWTSAAIRGWPSAWGRCWASGCPGTSSTPMPPAPCGTSGAAGTSVSALGSGTMCISHWAAAKRGRAVPT